MKKICLITPTQPAANPRIVKEANLFAAQGYNVTILYCFATGWAQEKDKSILKNALWNYKQIGGKNKSSYSYRLSRFFFAFYKFINKKSGGAYCAEEAHARCYSALLQAAIKLKADWYIGHNPGAMAIAINAATSTGAKAGFDFEDYHRGEYTDVNDPGAKRQVYLEKKYADRFEYLSAASPMIMEKITTDFPILKPKVFTLLNTFPLKEQPKFRTIAEENRMLSLFWFSQHLGRNRGLEIIINALRELNDPNIQLTLSGNYSSEIYNYFTSLSGASLNNIHFAGIISPQELPSFASSFDIGLALEPTVPVNRDICLTNKIFTYLLAGNAIIFSQTAMQDQFNAQYHTGRSFAEGNTEELKQAILFYKDFRQLEKQREYNYLLAKEHLNWETESIKLLQTISSFEN